MEKSIAEGRKAGVAEGNRRRLTTVARPRWCLRSTRRHRPGAGCDGEQCAYGGILHARRDGAGEQATLGLFPRKHLKPVDADLERGGLVLGVG